MRYLALLLALCTLSAHAALEVYDSTCALPKAPLHKFYVDAIKGNDITGDGSASKPWKSIQSVFTTYTVTPAVPAVPAVAAVPATDTTPAIPAKPAIAGVAAVVAGPRYSIIPYSWVDPVTKARVFKGNPALPVKPGDAIELATGNYGAVGIGVYTFGINPDQFLTIEPIPGAKPVLESITMSGVGHLYFHDIKVQNIKNGGTLVAMSAQGVYPTVEGQLAQYPTADVILDRMTFSGTDTDPALWTADDWNTKPANAVSMYPFTTRCISVTNSNFSAIAGAVGVGGERAVVSRNTINYFRDDGIDFYGNWLRMNGNKLTNSVATTEIHKDFFQGQIGKHLPGMTTNHYHDIEIDGNTMIGTTEAKNKFYTYTQGINTFDEDWTNLKATNNVIIAASCHGIGFSSVHGGEIANNVVLHDQLRSTPGCDRGSIGAGGSSHEGTTSDHIHIHHNLTQTISIDLDQGNTWDNNMLVGNNAQYVPLEKGVLNWGYIPGPTDPNNNKFERQMSGYAPAGYRYDVRPVVGSMTESLKIGPTAGFYVPSPGVSTPPVVVVPVTPDPVVVTPTPAPKVCEAGCAPASGAAKLMKAKAKKKK